MPPIVRFLLPGAVAAAMLLAGCGGAGQASSGAAGSGYRQDTAGAAGAAGAVQIDTASGALGTYLVGASGRALYVWGADRAGHSSCAGACARAWPPVTVTTMPSAAGAAHAAALSLITRGDGSRQVAYRGRPLYYYAGDASSGTTHGQGSDQFGARWWLLTPAGDEDSRTPSRAAPSGYGGWG